jgi:hypothetical protein
MWTGHATRMLEVGTEAALKRMTRTPRLLSLRHAIVTFGTCLNCQSLSAVKDMHTSVSVSVQDTSDPTANGSRSVRNKPDNSSDLHKVVVRLLTSSSFITHVAQMLLDSIPVVVNHDVLFYALLGLHSYIVMLADPHQEIKFQIDILRDDIKNTVR